jgi:peroxiredoxin Q/BCP
MTTSLAAGNPAPPFTLPREGKPPLSLDTFAGSKLVLYFYPKDDTSGCTAEAIDFNALRGAFDEAGAKILGVSPDSAQSHDKFKLKHDLALDLGSDEERTMLQKYGVWVEKSMYGRRYMGVERTTVLIDRSGCVAKVWDKVKVPGHAKDVLAAVRALP